MTYDLIDTFKEYFKNNKVILDSYKMNDGYYYLIKQDGTMQRTVVKGNESDNYELFEYLKIRDFYSKYLNSNKALDTGYTEELDKQKYSMAKKISSNNIYTLFFYSNNILGLCSSKLERESIPVEVFEKGIQKYYESLQKLGTKREEKELLEISYNKEEVEVNRNKMIKAFYQVYMDFQKHGEKKGALIKIFLDETEEEYERVANIYFTLKLFNTNSNNIKFKNKVYGVNNYNYGLNSNKPYLELKSTPYKIGSFISTQEIKLLNKIYIWLYNNGSNKNVFKLPIDWNFKGIPQEDDDIKNKDMFVIKINKETNMAKLGQSRIDDFQYKTNFSTKIRRFICKDYIRKVGEEFQTENIYGLEWYTNNIWIAGNQKCERNFLRDSYYDYDAKIAKSMLQNWKKDFLRKYSNVFFELFQKEEESNFIKNLNEMAIEILENMMIEELKEKKSMYKSINVINLWIAFKKYFNKKGEDIEMKINNIQDKCSEIFSEIGKIETDEQYYYFAGQVAFYLLNHSKASSLTQDVTSPFIKAANLKRLKEELKYLYEKYNYDIYLNNSKFNNILSQLLLQEPETSVKENKDIILAGMLANNLFYSKKEIDNGGNEDGENE